MLLTVAFSGTSTLLGTNRNAMRSRYQNPATLMDCGLSCLMSKGIFRSGGEGSTADGLYIQLETFQKRSSSPRSRLQGHSLVRRGFLITLRPWNGRPPALLSDPHSSNTHKPGL